MKDWRRAAKNIGIRVPAWKVPAFDYLTRAGMRFCVEFGLDNAVDIARNHWRGRRRKKP